MIFSLLIHIYCYCQCWLFFCCSKLFLDRITKVLVMLQFKCSVLLFCLFAVQVCMYLPIWGTSYVPRLPLGERNMSWDEKEVVSANGDIEFWSRFCQESMWWNWESGRGRRKESRSRCSGCGVASAHTQTAAASTAHIAACTLTPSGDHCAQPSVTPYHRVPKIDLLATSTCCLSRTISLGRHRSCSCSYYC